MDFRLNSKDLEFREEIREFLIREWPGGTGDTVPLSAEGFEQERIFNRKLAQRGWLTMAWPKAYGGEGAGHLRQALMKEECAYAEVTGLGGPGGQGPSMVGPSIIVHGTEEQKKRFLPPILAAEVTWCQGFSEPGAGSDLASVQTRAERQGDSYIINGQKIWTSAAESSDWIHVLARTDPDAPKHKGISYFLVDMRSPGISTRPIVKLTDSAGFYETYFDNVVVPAENRLGEENRGWYVATTTLDLERSGSHRVGLLRRWSEWVLEELRAVRATLNPAIRSALAGHLIEIEIGKWLAYRVAWLGEQGRLPNHEASISKCYNSELIQRFAGTAVNSLGLRACLRFRTKFAVIDGRPSLWYMTTASHTIAGGTSEIQRNVIAQRGLGLPRG